MKQLSFSIVSTILFVILPLTPEYNLFLDEWRLWITVIFVFLLNFTQPTIDSGNNDLKSGKDKSTVYLIIFASALSLVVPILDWRINGHENNYLSALGVLLCFFGLYIRYTAISQLGKFFTAKVMITNNHKLYKNGLYKILRHPSYTGALLSFISVSIWFNSLIGFFVSISTFLVVYFFRIKYEEELLLEHFGNEYKNYKKETYRLIPYVW